jgi:hypothetical protein
MRSALRDPQALQTMGRRAREISFAYDRVKQLKIFSDAIEEAAREGRRPN